MHVHDPLLIFYGPFHWHTWLPQNNLKVLGYFKHWILKFMREFSGAELSVLPLDNSAVFKPGLFMFYIKKDQKLHLQVVFI